MVGLVGLVTACTNSTRSTQATPTRGRSLAANHLGGPIGAIPGTMPQRLCTNTIFAGNNAARVVPTPDDVIIGPVRFSTLRQAAQPNQYSSHTHNGLEYGIKVPLTVFGTDSTWIAIRVSDDEDRVKVSYSPGFSGQINPKGESNLMALQSAIPCGNGMQGFVQYNGGFSWFHPSCATLQVFDQTGRLLGSKLIPFGKRNCS